MVTKIDKIKAIIVDSSRRKLYTLSDSSSIKIYDLGNNPGQLSVHNQFNDIKQIIHMLLNSSFSQDLASFSIVSIHVIPESESTRVCLVAIASNGLRLYFGLKFDYSNNTEVVEPLHARYPPSSQIEGNTGPTGNFHAGFYSNGVFLVTNAVNSDTDNLLCISSDYGKLSSRQARQPFEFGEKKVIVGKINEFIELTTCDIPITSNITNEIYMQLWRSSRKFAILTNSGK